jgi:hypothetical protein
MLSRRRPQTRRLLYSVLVCQIMKFKRQRDHSRVCTGIAALVGRHSTPVSLYLVLRCENGLLLGWKALQVLVPTATSAIKDVSFAMVVLGGCFVKESFAIEVRIMFWDSDTSSYVISATYIFRRIFSTVTPGSKLHTYVL